MEADRAFKQYIEADEGYTIPFHELFKGTMLGQWAHYREARANCLNLFDARLGSRRLRLLRLLLLQHLYARARHEQSMEVLVSECVELASFAGATQGNVYQVLGDLAKAGLVRDITPERELPDATIVISRTGAYYVTTLGRKFVYVEACMFDTAIEDESAWDEIVDLTHFVEHEKATVERVKARRLRIEIFLDYLVDLEAEVLALLPGGQLSPVMPNWRGDA